MSGKITGLVIKGKAIIIKSLIIGQYIFFYIRNSVPVHPVA